MPEIEEIDLGAVKVDFEETPELLNFGFVRKEYVVGKTYYLRLMQNGTSGIIVWSTDEAESELLSQ